VDVPLEDIVTVVEDLRCPGLTAEASEFAFLKEELPRLTALLRYKRTKPIAWLVFVGGTGTGKSTLFNALCEKPISLAGVERPKTGGPVAYAHEDSSIADDFPLKDINLLRVTRGNTPLQPVSGKVGHLVTLAHGREEWRNLILVDTPDLDSVEMVNRRVAGDLLRLSDGIIFVSSEEKYADEVPNSVLARMLKSGKPCFFLLNKVRDHVSGTEVIQTLKGFGISLPERRTWLIPFINSPTPEKVRAEASFQEFREHLLSSMSGEGFRTNRQGELQALFSELRQDTGRMLDLLLRENRASESWLKRLEEIRHTLAAELTETLKRHYMQESRNYLGEKVRGLFAKYDVLAGPRRLIRGILLTPFRILGLGKETRPEFSRETLARIRKAADYGPVLRAVERFHIRVLQELSPADRTSPLFIALREEELTLDKEEILSSLGHAFEELDSWLEETFEELARGIPATKKWGIYTTSILWGILIISMEVAVGGGFSILDAAIDSALAPFVTRGAVEMFAAQEIRKIARELGDRYQKALTTPLREQHDRFAHCLRSLLVPPEAMAGLEKIHMGMSEPLDSSGGG
jgi:GTPase SAR1 family protein